MPYRLCECGKRLYSADTRDVDWKCDCGKTVPKEAEIVLIQGIQGEWWRKTALDEMFDGIRQTGDITALRTENAALRAWQTRAVAVLHVLRDEIEDKHGPNTAFEAEIIGLSVEAR